MAGTVARKSRDIRIIGVFVFFFFFFLIIMPFTLKNWSKRPLIANTGFSVTPPTYAYAAN